MNGWVMELGSLESSIFLRSVVFFSLHGKERAEAAGYLNCRLTVVGKMSSLGTAVLRCTGKWHILNKILLTFSWLMSCAL